MTPQALMALPPGPLRLTFADGEVVRVRILSIDPDVADNHVFYDLDGIEQTGTFSSRHRVGQAFAASAQSILKAEPL